MGNPSTGSASISPKIKEIQDKLHKAYGPTSQSDENHKSDFKLDEVDKLSLEIADEVIRVCDIFINGGKVARGVGVPEEIKKSEEIKESEEIKKNKEKIKIFLTGLAYRLADASVLREKMVEFKELINKKQNHFKDLCKLGDGNGRDDDVVLVRVLLYNKAFIGAEKESFRSPISLQSYPLKLHLMMKEIKEGSDKKDDTLIKTKFNEIRDVAGISSNKDAEWSNLIKEFEMNVEKNVYSSEFMEVLVNCAQEASKVAEKSCSFYLNRIISMQSVLRYMMENNKYNKEIIYSESKEAIPENVKEYKEYVESIIGKIKKGSKYYKRLSEEDQNMACRICKFLNENLKKCNNSEDKNEFLKYASYINSELIVENSADEEIRDWYESMKACCTELSKALELKKCLKIYEEKAPKPEGKKEVKY